MGEAMEISDEEAKRLAKEIETLTRAVLALDRDVQKLALRMFPGETLLDDGQSVSSRLPDKCADDMIARLREARHSLSDSQGLVGQIHARANVILNKVVSREELEKHFKIKPRDRDRDGT